MATFRFEVNSKPNRQGKFTIFLCITSQGIRKRIKTTAEISNRDNFNFEAKNQKWIRSKEPQYKKLNETLSDELTNARQVYSDLKKEGRATSENIASKINYVEKTFSFFKFADDFAQETFDAGDYNTYKKYNTFLNKLKFFVNGRKPDELIKYKGKELQEVLSKFKKDLKFDEITLAFLNKFKAFLQKQPNSRNPKLTLHPNTISKQLDQFASLYNKGIKNLREEGLKIDYNPFNDFEHTTTPTTKEKLSYEEIRTIQALKLDQGTMLWHCRNYFLFAFYCAGIRAGDLIQLRQSDIEEGRLEYKMGKNERQKSIRLLPEALDILNLYMNLDKPNTNYIFPLLDNNATYAIATTQEEKEQLPAQVKKKLLQQVNSKNSLINNYLQDIAKLAGINKKLTFHIARHSFANIARQKKANVYDISKALGHSSIKITETYLSNFDTISQDETMDKVFNSDTKEEILALLGKMKPEEMEILIGKIRGT